MCIRDSSSSRAFAFATFTTFTGIAFVRWASLSSSVFSEKSSILGVAWVHTVCSSALASWLGSLFEVSGSGLATFAWCAWGAWLVVAAASLLVLGLPVLAS